MRFQSLLAWGARQFLLRNQIDQTQCSLLLAIFELYVANSEEGFNSWLFFHQFRELFSHAQLEKIETLSAKFVREAVTFHGGTLARPWLSLFVVSDNLYFWATASGAYDWMKTGSGILTLLVDIAYLAAYLVMGWGVLQQYLLLSLQASDE